VIQQASLAFFFVAGTNGGSSLADTQQPDASNWFSP
jgi:hypothetical protein